MKIRASVGQVYVLNVMQASAGTTFMSPGKSQTPL